jgi:hypothetical protein
MFLDLFKCLTHEAKAPKTNPLLSQAMAARVRQIHRSIKAPYTSEDVARATAEICRIAEEAKRKGYKQMNTQRYYENGSVCINRNLITDILIGRGWQKDPEGYNGMEWRKDSEPGIFHIDEAFRREFIKEVI